MFVAHATGTGAAPEPEANPQTSAVKPRPSRAPTGWKVGGNEAGGRRKEVAWPARATGDGVSPLATTTAQLAMVLIVVGVVGGVVAAFTLRTPRR